VNPQYFKNLLVPLLLVIFIAPGSGQDLQYSQFYASPLYLSPSLAGATDGGRVIMNYRNQWPGISTAFSTYAISIDNFFSEFNSGLGFLLQQDKAGSAGLSTTQAAFQYSYNLVINDKWQIVPAIQFGYGNRAIDFSKLVFGDEMIGGGASGSWDQLSFDQVNYADFAASALVYSPWLWAGLTIDHLTEPNYSFLGERMQLPRKFVFFGGINIWTERTRNVQQKRSFATSFRIQHQQNFNQADLGVYWFNDPIELGLWYRGLPLIKEVEENINQDALVLLLSYRYGPYRFGYSYYITISDLGWQTAGAHELSIIFEFNQKNKSRNGRRPAVPCSDSGDPADSDYSGKYRKKSHRIF
jgi:type IX secretion system PorP/SprF family membrane protein